MWDHFCPYHYSMSLLSEIRKKKIATKKKNTVFSRQNSSGLKIPDGKMTGNRCSIVENLTFYGQALI